VGEVKPVFTTRVRLVGGVSGNVEAELLLPGMDVPLVTIMDVPLVTIMDVPPDAMVDVPLEPITDIPPEELPEPVPALVPELARLLPEPLPARDVLDEPPPEEDDEDEDEDVVSPVFPGPGHPVVRRPPARPAAANRTLERIEPPC